jgi:hypothetical protein
MVDKKIYHNMAMKDLFLILKKLRIQRIAGEKILFPVTAEQRKIFTAFSIKTLVLS